VELWVAVALEEEEHVCSHDWIRMVSKEEDEEVARDELRKGKVGLRGCYGSRREEEKDSSMSSRLLCDGGRYLCFLLHVV